MGFIINEGTHYHLTIHEVIRWSIASGSVWLLGEATDRLASIEGHHIAGDWAEVQHGAQRFSAKFRYARWRFPAMRSVSCQLANLPRAVSFAASNGDRPDENVSLAVS